MRFISLLLLVIGLIGLSGPTSAARADGPDFAREVRPILSGHCFKCHGPDDKSREAGLRLDSREGATAKLESGSIAIVPGKVAESELLKRIHASDADTIMPPPAANKPLSAAEKKTLEAWIASGAKYEAHWAFIPPKQAPLPKVQQTDWPQNAIDQFILAKLEAAGLKPAPAASKATLVRRVYLDLIGLPPTPAEADAFLNDADPKAYDKLVDTLLKSPHYGERWARRWLDLARYADTNGYEKDRARSIWPYRDWVINALNADMPFDQFSIEQLAGDMLPGATVDQRIATGFHRNTMLNEEGGIDPLEFRFYSSVDRINTTAITWLGMTVGCAQCHTHKFDPITHTDYYSLLALLNNADEPTLDIPRPELVAKRAELSAKIAELEADLPNQFPAEGEMRWSLPENISLSAASGASAEKLADGSFRLSGTDPEKDTYTLTLDSNLTDVTAIRVEALADPALPSQGPGRTPHGNFVLTEISATAGESELKFARAEADWEQKGYPVADALDGKPTSGWAVDGPPPKNVNRTATFWLDKPAGVAAGTKWTIRLDHQFGTHHTLGRVRVQLGQTNTDGRPLSERQAEHRDRKFAAWLAGEQARSVGWKPLTPQTAKSNSPLLTIEADGVVFVSGDKTKRDVFDLSFTGDFTGVTAVRLEVLPDDRLPNHGPGSVAYEGPFGDFYLTKITAAAGGQPQEFASATHSFAAGGNTAAKAIDADPQSGWSVDGGQGKRHEAVFRFAQPLTASNAFDLQMVFERYYAPALGKFRLWVTTSPQGAEAREMPNEVAELLQISTDKLSPPQRQKLLQTFCGVAPELALPRKQIQTLRDQLPAFPTSLVMLERPANNPRPTFVHKRGEFLQPTDPVQGRVLSLFAPLTKTMPHNRLEFARWLVSAENPLVGRVTMNRQWQTIFGRGLVRTTDDFGYQGESPTHPELLDWLAIEFMQQGWSLKKMHKLMVTSATYQQSAEITPQLLQHDPQNRLLGRAPRVRLEAEQVRDSVLKVSGLISPKLGGPSVFPPQPASITTEGAYGSLAWTVSTGEDRFRRGLYTFTKRTTPYAMFNTFDGPSGEACIARREISNTPLQALTLLNDSVILEAAQALGNQLGVDPRPLDDKLTDLFRRCLVRQPTAAEMGLLTKFYTAQKERLTKQELDASKLTSSAPGDPIERAAWTLLARSLLNLDETVTKE